MNKIKEAICSFLTVMLCFFPLTGCYNHSDPESVVIDGAKYVTGFYGNMANNVPYQKSETCLFETENHRWWKYEDSVYEFYYCNHKESMIWVPVVYCREEQFDEVKAYYEDPENYEFYFRKNIREGIKIPDEADKSLLNEAVLYGMRKAKDRTYDPFDGFEYTIVERDGKDTNYLATVDFTEVVVYRVSKDGVFNSQKTIGYYYLEGKLYAMVRRFNVLGTEFTDTFYHLNAEPYTYYLSLFEKYALPQILADKEAAEAEEPGESEKTSAGIAVG